MKSDPKKKPYLYNSLFLTEKLNLPTDRATINAWCRSFVSLEPIIHDVVEFYSTYPCKFLQVQHPSQKEIKRFFEDQFDKILLMEQVPEIVKQYWTLGECFIYAELDEMAKMWHRLIIQNPDYVIVKSSITGDQPEIFLRPDEKLRTLILKENPSEGELKELARMDKSIVERVKNEENIPLSNFYVSHLCRKQSPYDVRGTSPLIPVLKTLAILGQVRTIEKEWNRTLSDQQVLEQEVKETLGHPDVFIKDGGAIRKDVAKTKMIQTMAMIKNWMERKILVPIAKINEFYEYKDGQKQLIIPNIVFDSKKFTKVFTKDCTTIHDLIKN